MNATTTASTLLDGTLTDCASALLASFEHLRTATSSAGELLVLSGNAGMRGDTADDLATAMAIHGHLLHQFQVKVRSAVHIDSYTAEAVSSYGAYAAAADRVGDTPCAISVTPAAPLLVPDRHALAAAHRQLRIAGTLDEALKSPALCQAIHTYARNRHRRAASPTDYKRNAANDRD